MKVVPINNLSTKNCTNCIYQWFWNFFGLSGQAKSEKAKRFWTKRVNRVNVLISRQIYIQGGFFNWSALKMTKSQTLRKFWHLELFWRDLHVIWHLVIFWADQLKKPPCIKFPDKCLFNHILYQTYLESRSTPVNQPVDDIFAWIISLKRWL